MYSISSTPETSQKLLSLYPSDSCILIPRLVVILILIICLYYSCAQNVLGTMNLKLFLANHGLQRNVALKLTGIVRCYHKKKKSFGPPYPKEAR